MILWIQIKGKTKPFTINEYLKLNKKMKSYYKIKYPDLIPQKLPQIERKTKRSPNKQSRINKELDFNVLVEHIDKIEEE